MYNSNDMYGNNYGNYYNPYNYNQVHIRLYLPRNHGTYFPPHHTDTLRHRGQAPNQPCCMYG